MVQDDRDILEILKHELDFLEKGEYRPSQYAPWLSKSTFQDSLSCINYGYPYRVHPCNECHLMDFVGSEHRHESIPCHFIPLNENGETVDSLEADGNKGKLELTLKRWLRASIERIEEDRSQLLMAGCP